MPATNISAWKGFEQSQQGIPTRMRVFENASPATPGRDPSLFYFSLKTRLMIHGQAVKLLSALVSAANRGRPVSS